MLFCNILLLIFSIDARNFILKKSQMTTTNFPPYFHEVNTFIKTTIIRVLVEAVISFRSLSIPNKIL